MPTLLYAGVLFSALFEVGWFTLAIAARWGMPEGGESIRLAVGRTSFTPADATALLVIAPMIILTWALRTRRRWARHAALAFWVAPLAVAPFPPGTSEAWAVVLTSAGIAALLAWYLFRSKAVRAYYEKRGSPSD